MKETVTLTRFRDAFHNMGRGNEFTYEGLAALFDHLEQYEDSTGEDVELDVTALCCEFTEYSDLEEFQSTYCDEYETIEDIGDETIVIPVGTDGFIIRNF